MKVIVAPPEKNRTFLFNCVSFFTPRMYSTSENVFTMYRWCNLDRYITVHSTDERYKDSAFYGFFLWYMAILTYQIFPLTEISITVIYTRKKSICLSRLHQLYLCHIHISIGHPHALFVGRMTQKHFLNREWTSNSPIAFYWEEVACILHFLL